ncbi:uncharacterized protein LOC127257533 [Andrographis paniculata]|uniref:uncharacterized protein LOC127257533 n=1 Tax=Andrographis paniculata TaxID=175694 RepID=UPI0021E92B3A|nr:uncharacterized protein LOC127257533 [Andrographis paniculata]
MGAMAPPTHWTPKDDLLLKNSIEDGASLEALEKGAVPFSQRYTMQELTDRWHSLLYNDIISKEASLPMAEIEIATIFNPSRNKSESLNETTGYSRKRKSESIRKIYYARRKRIRNEPFDVMHLNPLSGPSHSILGDINKLQSADCGIGNPISIDLGIQNPDFDLGHHSFSEFGRNASESLAFPFEENLSPLHDQSQVPGFDQLKHLPLSNIFDSEGVDNRENACLEFGDHSFDSFGCSSPLPQMPGWNTSPDIPVTDLPFQNENVCLAGDTFLLPPCGVANADDPCTSSSMKAPLPSDTISTEDYFNDLSDTLFALSNEDELKESIDKNYLDSLGLLLLNSPNRVELPDANLDPPVEGAAEEQHFPSSGVHSAAPDVEEVQYGYEPEVQAPDALVASSASNQKKLGPEYRNGVICCVLNTEDPEIPSNDDVFLPFRRPSPTSPSGMPWRLHDSRYFTSFSPDIVSSRKENVRSHGLVNNQIASSRSIRVPEPSQPSDIGLKGSTGSQGVKFELPKSNVHHAAVRNSRNHDHISSANAAANNAIDGALRDMGRGKSVDYKFGGNSCFDKYKPVCPDARPVLQNGPSSSRNVMNIKPEILNDERTTNMDSTLHDAAVENAIDKLLMSDPDEQWSDYDFDVPDFSDVEAMILDMDLQPPGEYALSSNPDVKRYQHEQTKRTIVRLEQSANACTQRAITSQGAFAVLYGRYSKYFIKKTKVLLGRATEDTAVDIDLGREKNGGKISRKQAIVKMDARGEFELKNLGRCSIFVNGNEVHTGESAGLTSSCLVQIRNLAYVFETNWALVKQYKNNVAPEGDGGELPDMKPNLPMS